MRIGRQLQTLAGDQPHHPEGTGARHALAPVAVEAVAALGNDHGGRAGQHGGKKRQRPLELEDELALRNHP